MQIAPGLRQIPYSEISNRVENLSLFGLSNLQQQLFDFCKSIIEADDAELKKLKFYDITPSVLLYGSPNTGKTTLCYKLFCQIKEEVTQEITFYNLEIGSILDPALGQSSRNLERAFQKLKECFSEEEYAFLLLDELDTFCMSRSRLHEHDGVRRTMTTFMLELDKLQSFFNRNVFVFGITNLNDLIDTAVVRRFCLKYSIDNIDIDFEEFKSLLLYLGEPLGLNLNENDLVALYEIFSKRRFTVGDIKSLYRELFIVKKFQTCLNSKIFSLFEEGFSTREHLTKCSKEFSNGKAF